MKASMKLNDSSFRDQRFFNSNRIASLPEQHDLRTPAQHDRDRILYSSAFKRLSGVTQVVDPSEGQIFHNRMIHTLKVAQVARRTAENLIKSNADLAGQFTIDPDVVEAAALAHDLGHPPFGHSSEYELDRLVKRSGLADGYEGNPQSFRIVNYLEPREPDEPGLNLTRATLNAIMKYPRFRQLSGYGHRKWGAYKTETSIFEWVRDGSYKERRSVEAEIMDFADDIAYSLHDLEDFSRAGLIPVAELLSSVRLRGQIVDEVLRESPQPLEAGLRENLIDLFALTPFGDPQRITGEERAIIRRWLSAFITRYINSISLNEEAISNPEASTVIIPSVIRDEIRLLKHLTRRFVINTRRLATQQEGKKRIIKDLFSIFMKAFNSTDTDDNAIYILPEDYNIQLNNLYDILSSSSIDNYRRAAKARLTADIISNMTDNEAVSIHKRLVGANSGSVMDIIMYSGFHIH